MWTSAARRPYVLCAIVLVAGLAGVARAGEPADRGVSLSAWAGGALDRSVVTADGRPLHPEALVAGLTGVGNIERVAIGGAVDVRPALFGDGRLSLSTLLGYQHQARRTRVQLLGEAGVRRFSGVGGDAATPELAPAPWLPFVGLRLGSTRTVPARGFFELGSWLFARYDVRQTTVSSVGTLSGGEEGRTDYRVGGFMVGMAMQVGLRLESPHPWNQGVEEVQGGDAW
jgi:hypothetical protein